MECRRHILVSLLLVILFGVEVKGWFWGSGHDWSESRPTNCPHEDKETHVCTSLTSANSTCTNSTFTCGTDDDVEDYDSESSDSDESHGHHHGHRRQCRWRFTIRQCTVYKCSRFCCDGYTLDLYDRCVNETNSIDCQNGGTSYLYWGIYKCQCPRDFTGSHCEIPVCDCQNGGQCQAGADGRTFCDCREGFVGANCSQRVCSLDCKNGGSCIADGEQQTCMCPNNYVGELCENYQENNRQCPRQNSISYFCWKECSDNEDCYGNKLCCKEGCRSVCRKPKDSTCHYNGTYYSEGAKIPNDDPCMNCTCLLSGSVRCTEQKCPRTRYQCEGGAPVQRNREECCAVCGDNPSHRLPIFENCPTSLVQVPLETGENYASLRRLTSRLVAKDHTGKNLTVSIQPVFIRHCRCLNISQNMKEVVAMATDSEGSSTECKFDVAVEDRESPRFHSCPDNIYVFEDEEVTWKEPTYSDNVGIYYKKCSRMLNGRKFAAGEYNISYTAVDYEYNYAICDFQIISTSRDTPFEKMPSGMRQRATDSKGIHAMVIAGPVIGIVLLVVGILLLLLCCRRYRNAQSTNRPRLSRQQRYDNNIYTVCGPPAPIKGVKLPQYSLPSNPPAYSADMKDGEYAYIAPPSYQEIGNSLKDSYENPAYETIPADRTEDEEKQEK